MSKRLLSSSLDAMPIVHRRLNPRPRLPDGMLLPDGMGWFETLVEDVRQLVRRYMMEYMVAEIIVSSVVNIGKDGGISTGFVWDKRVMADIQAWRFTCRKEYELAATMIDKAFEDKWRRYSSWPRPFDWPSYHPDYWHRRRPVRRYDFPLLGPPILVPDEIQRNAIEPCGRLSDLALIQLPFFSRIWRTPIGESLLEGQIVYVGSQGTNPLGHWIATDWVGMFDYRLDNICHLQVLRICDPATTALIWPSLVVGQMQAVGIHHIGVPAIPSVDSLFLREMEEQRDAMLLAAQDRIEQRKKQLREEKLLGIAHHCVLFKEDAVEEEEDDDESSIPAYKKARTQ
jgi:hypothetical protein